MKATIIAAILAGCGLVSAIPPPQNSYSVSASSTPESSSSVSLSSRSRRRCSRYHPPSSSSAVPSVTPSSSVVPSSSSVLPSVTPSSSIPSSTPPPSSSSVAPSSSISSAPSSVPSSISSEASSSVPSSISSAPSSSIPSSISSAPSSSVPSSISSTPSSSIPSSISSAPSSSIPSSVALSSVVSSVSSAAPPQQTCGSVGTGFGYDPDDSETLRSQAQCSNRWGWFITPTLAELQSPGTVGGTLYVGAGNNDISNSRNVGTWTATADAQGGVTVTYNMASPYYLDEVHVELRCLPFPTPNSCAPGQWTHVADDLDHLTTYSNPNPIPYPTCNGNVALVLHASVGYFATGNTCTLPPAGGSAPP